MHKEHIRDCPTENAQKRIPFPALQPYDDSDCSALPETEGSVKDVRLTQAVDNKHGDDCLWQDTSQINNRIRRLFAGKNEKRKKS